MKARAIPSHASTRLLEIRPMQRLIVSFAAALVLSGCVEEFDGFARRASRLQCKRLQRCDRETFDWSYDNRRECRDNLEDQWQDRRDRMEANECTYDPEEGRRCIDAMVERRRKCSPERTGEIQDACRLVFDCFP
jgi:hypothetical protein